MMPGPLTRVVFAAALITVMARPSGTFCTGAEAEFKTGVRLALDESRTLGWAAPEVVDWNNDGWPDVLVGRHSGAMSLHLNRGIGPEGLQFQKATIIRHDHFRNGGKPVWAWRFNKANCVCPGPGRICPRVLDWDHDGKKDLVIGDGQGAQIRIWRNVGTDVAPEFSTHHIQYLPPDGGVRPYHETVQPCIADWNGDGNRDLLMGRNRGLYVYINQHTDDSPKFDFDGSRLGTKLRNLFPDQRLSPVFTDWDEDGQQDLVVGSQQGEVWFARNVGTATQPKFAAYKNVKAGGENISLKSEARIAIADLDGDGQQDLLVGDGTGIVRFYQGNQTDTGVSNGSRPVNRPRPVPADVPTVNDPPPVVANPTKPQAKPAPGKAGDLPIVDITYQSPCVEPATAGVLKLTRTGNLMRPVTVHLTTRLHHHPVVADVHYVPIPSSVTLKSGQKTADVLVTPIDDTLVNGAQTLTFRIVPDPAYKLASKLGAATMKFLDDDCPSVGIRALNDEAPNPNGERRFLVTALPAPRLDTVISYSTGGTAVGGTDYIALSGKVTIAAGETTATITVRPYRQLESARPKSVVLSLPDQPFTYFNFYRYLTLGQPRTAKVELISSDTSPVPPKQDAASPNQVEDATVQKLRLEVARLGWIVFTANSGGPTSDLDLFVMRPDGSQLRNITNTPTFDEFSARVSPDGQQMLYRRTTKTSRVSPRKALPQDVGNVALRTWPAPGSLVIANADGSNPKPVGGDRDFAWATWGPNGKQVACLEPQANPALPKKPASYRIVIRDADTLNVIKELPSGGILSHAVWSPDGKWICGRGNVPAGRSKLSKGFEYPLGVGKMVSVNVESGKRVSMARFPDWSPVWATDSDGDWFQGGSPQTLHSANNYGICPAYFAMLWRSGLESKPSELVFAEFKKHVWGGCTSPDDKYAIFVISGDRWPLQGKMAILRLADAPIARGDSQLFHEVLADYFPNLSQGPVLDLPHIPAGFEPHWTLAELAFDSGKSADDKPTTPDLVTPEMTTAEAAAGRRVRQVAPEYQGTKVYHALYLPVGWKPGGKYPVIVEYTGNKFPACGSTGEVKGANLGYGLTGGKEFIWVSMPYIEKGGRENAVTWWGDKQATVDYCKTNLPRICEQFGGDLESVFICGFSRGAIGASYIGLADDEIASFWKGMITHDHFDGDRTWGYADSDRKSALVRLARLKGRPVLACGVGNSFLEDHPDVANVTFLRPPVAKIFKIPEGKVIHPHTDLWMHRESEYRDQARQWLSRHK